MNVEKMYVQSEKMVYLKMLFLALTFFGIPFALMVYLEYKTHHLYLLEKSILIKKGIIGKQLDEMPYKKINSIRVIQGLFGRVLGYGDVIVVAGNDSINLTFAGVDEPQKVKQKIEERMGE